MTLSTPSAFAFVTRASIPPNAAADVAVAALPLLPDPLPPEPPPELQALIVSPAASTAIAGARVRRRKVSSRCGPAAARSGGRMSRILAEHCLRRGEPERER